MPKDIAVEMAIIARQTFVEPMANPIMPAAFEVPDLDQPVQPKRPLRHLPIMPRYFFHVFDDASVIDEEGQELDDVAAARTCAVRSARELAGESVRNGRLNLDHRIEVTGEDHGLVLILAFREAFEVIGQKGHSHLHE